MPRLLLRICGVALILAAGVLLALHYGIFGLLLWADHRPRRDALEPILARAALISETPASPSF